MSQSVPAPEAGRSAPALRTRRNIVRRRLWLGIRLSIAALFVVAILYWVDLGKAIASLRQSDWRWLAVAFAVAFNGRYLMAYKWATLLRVGGIAISNREALRIYLSSSFVGTFLPTSVGADVVKLTRTALSTGRADKVAASILMERALGLLSIITLAVAGLLFVLSRGEKQYLPVFYFACLAFLGVGAVLLVSLRHDLWAWTSRRLAPFGQYRLVQMLAKFHRAFIELGSHKRVLVVFFLLSLLQNFLSIITAYTGGLALGFSMSFAIFAAVVPVINLLGMAPISVGGIGFKEGLYVLFFALAGLSGGQALSLALLIRAVTLLITVPGGLIFLQDSLRLRKTHRHHEAHAS